MDQIERLTKTSFAFEVVPSGTTLPQRFFKQFSAETVKVIGCLASGGPGGVQGWHDLFLDVPKRQALVCAIISNVLVEQVFQHIFFGGIAKHVKNLTMLQEQHCNEDGFDRNTHYANHIRNILDPENSNRYFLPVNFANHVNYIVGAIWTHIRPIIKLRYYNPTTTTTTHTTDPIHDIIASLHKLVTHAAILSLSMRIDPHTVYAFDPVFKEDKFISRYMDCINQAQMQQSHPRALQYNADLTPQERNRRANISEKEAERALEDEPLVQIAIMPGLTAYRRGGWETVDSSVLGAPRFREEGYADMGYRARSLSAAWVFCRWGCVGRGEGGIDGAEVHGDAWVEPGFVEFVDVNGVNGGRGCGRMMCRLSLMVSALGR
ncbi:hypothetical protein GQ44DRAFT_647100 [Phaeosphaeriaceae sp. PMI808]|nr:hypothetical protein GQ44DRAFT_647100 [Phaeosphaeriaceae sp. PMI808]